MSNYNIQLKDKNDNNLFPKTLGTLVVDSNDNQFCEQGAEVNIIEEVQVNSIALTPDANRAVNVPVPTYTLQAVQTPGAGFSAQYELLKDGVATGDTINIPIDLVVSQGTTVHITYDANDNILIDDDSGDDVTSLINPTNPSAADEGPYIRLTIVNNDLIYISINGITGNTYSAGDGIKIDTSNTISVDYGAGITITNNKVILHYDSTKGLDVDPSVGLRINLGPNGDSGLEFDGNDGHLQVKLDSTNGSGLSIDSYGLKIKLDSNYQGLKINGNDGLALNIDSSSDFEYGSNGLHLAGEASGNFVTYYSIII